MNTIRANLIMCLCVIVLIMGLAGCHATSANNASKDLEKTETTYQSPLGSGQIGTEILQANEYTEPTDNELDIPLVENTEVNEVPVQLPQGNLPSSEYSEPIENETDVPSIENTEVNDVSVQWPQGNVPYRSIGETDAKNSPTLDPFAEFTSNSECVETIEIMKKVLRNEAKFIEMVEDGKSEMLLSEYYLAEDASIMDFELEFTVVDMDGDGIPEVILNLMGPDIRLVLYNTDGYVVGCFFGIKGLNIVKKDGSFSWGSAYYYGFSRLRFTGESCEYIELAAYEYEHENEYIDRNKYTIGGAEVTQEEFEAFMDSQDRKEDSMWYKLT
ncbi:MAG: hypothetical protein FWH57_11375 [Oscillospiraceae bacterium]|nr:hypothetical protein [Oscillospiraceae bacterium]